MTDFLLELFSEEMPARMQTDAAKHLQVAFDDALKQAGISAGEIKAFVTPRHLAIIAFNLPVLQPDVVLEKKGPKTTAPQAALEGFLRKEALTLEQLEKRGVGKDEIYFASIHKKGEKTADLLKVIIEKILTDFPWPKSMRWGSNLARWVRPLHAIACIFGDEIIPVTFAGLVANNITYGHRFLAPGAILLTTPAEYEAILLKVYVIADPVKRKAQIWQQAQAHAARHGLQLKHDNKLLDEVTGLVEFPTVLAGTIDQKFMDLPHQVLVSEMRAHQKYFALLNADGSLASQFLITSNMTTQDEGKAIIAGNERVLRARLSDGRFFYDQDRKKTLSQWADSLHKVTFHAKIGSIAQKVENIKMLALQISPYVKHADATLVEQAANLCKADLVTGMVGEFPELQGIMGRYYAIAEGLDSKVAEAICDHYLPLGADSPVPTEPESVCIALADKLDTLISMFSIGEKPTGSKDPFALRRAALGIIRIILENTIHLPLKVFLNEELLQFFHDRLKVMLRDKNIRHDVIDAVITNGEDDIWRIYQRATVLQRFLGTEEGTSLLAGYKRANNILMIEEKKNNTQYNHPFDYDLPTEKPEVELAQLLEKNSPLIKNLRSEEKITQALQLLSELRIPVDEFFTAVLVNHANNQVRENRLNLLTMIRDTFNSLANFALIEG